jgi:hypothetical protein
MTEKERTTETARYEKFSADNDLSAIIKEAKQKTDVIFPHLSQFRRKADALNFEEVFSKSHSN